MSEATTHILQKALERIQNVEANHNSEPDVMGEALSTIKTIAGDALRRVRQTEGRSQ